MNNHQNKSDEVKDIRNRMKYEDGLLNTRTTLVLTFNGLMAIAAGVAESFLFWIVIVILIFDVFWFICSIEAYLFIKRLENILEMTPREQLPREEQEHIDFVNNFILTRMEIRFGPTVVIGIVMPLLLLLGWIGGIIWST